MRSNRRKYIVVLGNILNETGVRIEHVSAAGNEWRRQLTIGLSETHEVELIGHVRAPRWPRGALHPGKTMHLDSNFRNNLVRCLNLPLYTKRRIGLSYIRAFEEVVQNRKGPPEMILAYNPHPWNRDVGNYATRKFGIPWCCLTLDLLDPRIDSWAKYLSTTRGATCHAFASSWAAVNSPVGKKMHFEGGVRTGEFSNASPTAPLHATVLYCGSVTEMAGANILPQIAERLTDINATLIVCGRGEANIERQLARCTNVEFFGFVTQAELNRQCERCSIFLNPRPTLHRKSQMNFPSKILFYLKYGKPIVSSWTPGLSEEYREILSVPLDETPEEYFNCLRASLGANEILLSRIRRFARNHSWERRCKDLTDFVYQSAL